MTYQCKNPVFTSADGSCVTLELNHPEYGWIPFTATANDCEDHGRAIYAAAISGEYGEIAPYVAPPPPEQQYKTVFSVLEFRERFTFDEQVAIKQSSYTDAEVGMIYDNFLAAQFIDLNDARVDNGLAVYVTKGLITEERKTEILQPELIAD